MGLRDILILAIVFASLPVSFARPWIGVLTWTWLGLMNPHKLSWSLTQFPIAQGVAAATLGGLLFTRDRRAPPLCFETVVLALLAADFTFTTYFAWYPEVSWTQWDKVMKILLFTFVTTMLIYGRERIRWLMIVAVGSLGFYGVKGGIFSLLTGGNYRIWGPAGSFIADNTALGLALCMVLPLALYSATAEKNRWLRLGLYTVFWLSIPAILFTYSRGAFIGLASVLLAILFRYKTRLLLVAFVLALTVTLAKDFIPEQWYKRQETTLNYEQDYSAMQRIQAWGVAVNIALDRPLLGAGFNFEYKGDTARWLSYTNFLGPWHNEERAAHSIYFQILGQHGFPGFAVFVTLLLGTMVRLHRLTRLERSAEKAWIGKYARAVQLSLIPYLVAGSFLSLGYFDLMYMLIAVSAILHREALQPEPALRAQEETQGEMHSKDVTNTEAAARIRTTSRRESGR